MASVDSSPIANSLLGDLLGEEAFCPREPETFAETGVTPVFVEELVLKLLLQVASLSGRDISRRVCLPFGLVEPLLNDLRSRQHLVHEGQAPLNDYRYALTDQGRSRAITAMKTCGYTGATPVPLDEYVLSVEAQTIRHDAVNREQMMDAFSDISIPESLFDLVGPAINSGAGLFLYGAPGNGKSTLAKRITRCFGRHIWLPRAIIEDGQIIKLFDGAIHEFASDEQENLLSSTVTDPRWVKVRRPTAIVGGELTMDNLELRHDPPTKVSEASLQLKSNGGCLLIDDFGRQRIDPAELLNRWIIPLENRCDYLTLASGRKVEVPFDQLIIFSTNIEPHELADEAFLRRIPYKVEVGDPCLNEFRNLFKRVCESLGCTYRAQAVDYLVEKHYRPKRLSLRRCHARDLMHQIRNYCAYLGAPLELRPDYLDKAVKAYFTALHGELRGAKPSASGNRPAES